MAAFTDRIAMLYEGKVLEVGTKDEIINSKNPLVRQFVNGEVEGPTNFLLDKDTYLEELTK